MHRKLIATCVALVALGAFAVIPAIASASPVLNEGGTALATGTKITAIGETAESSKFTSGFITVECNDVLLTGTVHTNSGTHIKVDVSKATFNSESGGVTGDCTSSLGATAVTVATPSWCITAGGLLGADKGVVEPFNCTATQAQKEAGKFEFTLHVTNAPFLGTQICTYKRTGNLEGSFTTASPGTLSLEKEPEFSLVAGGSGGCSGTGKLVRLKTRLYTDTETETLSTNDPVAIS